MNTKLEFHGSDIEKVCEHYGLKKEMAEELVRNFMQEMEDLGFQKGDIIDRIADYKEEEK